MESKLDYIGSDEYKIGAFKKKLEQEILKIAYLREQNRLPFSGWNDNIVIEKVLSNFKHLYNKLNENIAVNEVLVKLILIEKYLLSEVCANETNVNLENLLFFIINAKLELLTNTRNIVQNVVELTQSAISSDNQELKKAGSVIINELLKHDEYEPINRKLNNALTIIEEYNRALETIKSYNIISNINESEIYSNSIEKIKSQEVTSLCEKIRVIIDRNYNI